MTRSDARRTESAGNREPRGRFRSGMPSGVIRSFAYREMQRQLDVTFQSGKRYLYEDVPPEIYQGMKSAFSKGEFFNEHIRDRYTFTRES